MSKTQIHLNNYLCFLVSAGFSAACSEAKYPTGNHSEAEYCAQTSKDDCVESTYCTQVYNEECPSAEEFASTYLPIETCDGLEHLEAISEATASEITMTSPSGDTAAVSESNSYTCCYDTLAKTGGPLCDDIPAGATEGRPLMFNGIAQAASISCGNTWSKGPLAKSHQLTFEQRQILSDFWLITAQMEHASVASFHQFALDLMRFGAPPELLMRTNKAIMDEISHARAAFAITEGFLNQALAPDDFHMKIQPATDLADFAKKVALEAAINETIAVILATLQRAQCTDDAIKTFLTEIIREEAEHAELAWDTLRWLLQKGNRDVFDSLHHLTTINFTPDVSSFPIIGIPSHGLPSQAITFTVLKHAYQHVVIPNLNMILEDEMVRTAVS